jgi:glycosyltransferase involved in cell wall biosynthesis
MHAEDQPGNHVFLVGPYPANPTLIKGGVEASLWGLAHALKDNHLVASVKVFDVRTTAQKSFEAGESTRSDDGIEVESLPPGRHLAAGSARHAPRIFRAVKLCRYPVVVHVHGTGLVQFLTLLWARIKRIPTVWTVHGVTELETLAQWRRTRRPLDLVRHCFYLALERMSGFVARRVIVDTHYVARVMPSLSRRHVHVIPQGIVLMAEPRSVEERFVHKAVLSVGVFSPRKGQDRTVESFASVAAQVPDARLTLAGISKDAEFLDLVKRRVQELDLGHAVDVVVDAAKSELQELLASSTLFALHSAEESQGIALCEALRAGLPVVATNVGGIPHVVDDRVTGLLSPFGNTDAFASSMLHLLTDENTHRRFAEAALRSGKRYEWSQVATRVAQTYAAAEHDNRRASRASASTGMRA